jgi:glycosyltransferase involved in cell wall biosynthesis
MAISIAGYCSPIDSGEFPTGVGQHIRAMFSGLANAPECDFSILSATDHRSSAWPEYARELRIHRLPLSDALSRLLLIHTAFMPISGAKHCVDWVYCPKEQPVNVRGAKLAVTCHDVRPFEGKIEGLPDGRPWHRSFMVHSRMKKVAARADVILAVSNYTKNRIQELFRVTDERTVVVGNGISPVMRQVPAENASQRILSQYALEQRGYLVAVGSLTRRKGGDAILAAAETLSKNPSNRLKIIVAGRRHDKDLLQQWSNSPAAIQELVLLPGYVPDSELNSLLRNSLGLLFPSRYEGFGIPVIEAMACQTRVLSSQGAALKEICAGHALEVDPNEPDSIVRAIEQVRQETEIDRSRALASAFDYAQQFTWEHSLATLIKTLQSRS